MKNKIRNSHTATMDIENEFSLQYFYNLIRKNSNFGGLINYEQTIKKTMKEIKSISWKNIRISSIHIIQYILNN